MAGNVVATSWVEIIPEIKGGRTKIAKDIGAEMEPAAKESGEKSGEQASGSFAASFGKGLKAVGGALIGGSILASLKELSDASLETSSEMGKLDTAFSTSGHSADTARSVYDGFVGVLGDMPQAVEASNHLAKLTSSTEELSQWTDIAAGVYATFGASLPLEGLTEAANETAKVGLVTGPFADALNWAKMSTEQWSAALSGNKDAQSAFMSALNQGLSAEDAFNAALAACNSEAERSSLVTSVMAATYGEAGQAYRASNADVIAAQKAQSDFNIAMGRAGAAVTPFVTGLTEIGTALLNAGVDKLPSLADGFSKAIQVASPFAIAIGGAAAALGVMWGVLNAGSITAFATSLMSGTRIMTLFTNATNIAKTAQAAFNLMLSANPIGVVITLIAALVAGLVWFFTQTEIGRELWSSFMSWLQSAWTNVQSFFSGLWNSIVGFFNSAATNVSAAWNAVVAWFSSIPATIMGAFAAIGNWLSSLFNGTANNIKSAWNAVLSFYVSIPGRIMSAFASIGNWIFSQFNSAANRVKSAWNGVTSFFGSIPDKIMGFFSNAGSWLINAGKSAIDGFLQGLKNAWDSAASWLSSRAQEIIKLKGPPSYDAVMLVENGELTMGGYQKGLENGFKSVQSRIAKMNSQISASVEPTISTATTYASSAVDGDASSDRVLTAIYRVLCEIRDDIPQGMTESDFARKVRKAVNYA